MDALHETLHTWRLEIGDRDRQSSKLLLTEIRNLSITGNRSTDTSIIRNMAGNVNLLHWPIPRLACVLPPHDRLLTEDDRRFETWSDRLVECCQNDKKTGNGRFKQQLRLFFLCAYDSSLAECGPGGQGYEVNQLLAWVHAAKPFVRVILALASILLKSFTGLG